MLKFVLFLCVSLRLVCQSVHGQEAVRPTLPVPSGSYAVGRLSFEVRDPTRDEVLSSSPGSKRRFMVQVWYPTDASSTRDRARAPYMPGFAEIRPKLSDADVNDMFRPASYAGPESLPVPDVYEGSSIARGQTKFPLLLFAQGWSNPTFLYTAELSDIASHGYVIVAVDHPYDSDFTPFPDGSVVFFAHQQFDAAARRPNGLNAYARERVRVMAEDNRVLLSRLRDVGSDQKPLLPFMDRVDFAKVGAFGHSIGGLTAARTCQIDSRVLACMDQDSIDYRGSPFAASDLGDIPHQPFFLFVVSSADIWSSKMVNPTDAELIPQRLSRVEYDSLIRKQQEAQDTQFAALQNGGYRLMLFDLPDFVHRSFTDQTLLAEKVDHQRAVANFRVTQAYTLAFFDKYLKGAAQPVLDQHKPVDQRAILQIFPPRGTQEHH